MSNYWMVRRTRWSSDDDDTWDYTNL